MSRFFPYIYLSCFLGGCMPDLGSRLTDQPHLEEDSYINLNQVPTREEALEPRGASPRDTPEEHDKDRQKLESEKKRLQQAQKTIRSKADLDGENIQ
jgi:hypothetical protein